MAAAIRTFVWTLFFLRAYQRLLRWCRLTLAQPVVLIDKGRGERRGIPFLSHTNVCGKGKGGSKDIRMYVFFDLFFFPIPSPRLPPRVNEMWEGGECGKWCVLFFPGLNPSSPLSLLLSPV